jgi:hypothetical protein
MRTEEWSLVGLWCVLIPVGVWAAFRPPKWSASAKGGKRAGWLTVLIGIGSLCHLLPKLLGWSHGVVMTFATVTFVPLAVMVILVLLDAARRCQPGPGEPHGSTATEYSNRADE